MDRELRLHQWHGRRHLRDLGERRLHERQTAV